MRRYLVLGVLLFLVLLVWRLPAGWVAGALPAGLQCQQTSGSLWRGRCETLHTPLANLQAVSWQLAALPLLLGRAQLQLQVDDPQLQASGSLEAHLGGAWRAAPLHARLPLESPLLSMVPRDYHGNLVADLSALAGNGAAITSATGTLQVLQLRSTAELGSYQLSFAPSTRPGEIEGALRDLEGPLQVEGTLHIHGRNYEVQGLAIPRGTASDALNQAMDVLGPPDEQGRRRFSLEGTI